jgi:hypothetical protein
MNFLKRNKSFLIVSAIIMLSDIIFIGLNYQASLSILKKETEEWAKQAENNFNISLENKATSMQQLATFIAGDPRIASLFKQGKSAVLSEGGGESLFLQKRTFCIGKPKLERDDSSI